MNHERFLEIAATIKEARDHLRNVGEGRGSWILDAALQEWEGKPVQWDHVDALDSKVRECVVIPENFNQVPF